MFQDDQHNVNDPEPYLNPIPKQPRKHENGSFRIVNVTPHSLDLVDAVIDRSADFDRALAAVKDCGAGDKDALAAYGDLVQAKGKLVTYLARLMDRVNDPNLNQSRSKQVRYE